MLENPICAVNRMSRCYWLDTGGRLRPNHVKRTDLGREPLFLTKSKGGSKITLAYLYLAYLVSLLYKLYIY